MLNAERPSHDYYNRLLFDNYFAISMPLTSFQFDHGMSLENGSVSVACYAGLELMVLFLIVASGFLSMKYSVH